MKGGIRGLCASKQDTRTLQSDLTYFTTPSISWNENWNVTQYLTRTLIISGSSCLVYPVTCQLADYKPDLWSSLFAILSELKAKCYWPWWVRYKTFRGGRDMGEIQSTLFDSMQTFLAISLLFRPDCIHTAHSAPPGFTWKRGAGFPTRLDRVGVRSRKMHDQICRFDPAGCSTGKKNDKKSGLKDRPTHFTWKNSAY